MLKWTGLKSTGMISAFAASLAGRLALLSRARCGAGGSLGRDGCSERFSMTPQSAAFIP
jgi:hypothetical protein